MLAAGVPVRTVAGRLGHADAATTLNVYGHWIEASDQVAATVLGDLLGNGDKAPTSPPSPAARRTARGAAARPRSGTKRAPQRRGRRVGPGGSDLLVVLGALDCLR